MSSVPSHTPSGQRRLARFDAVLVGAAVLIALVGTQRESVAANGGLGFDGLNYGTWAMDLPAAFAAGLTVLDIQRILPPAIVWAGLQVVGTAPTRPNVIAGFEALNVLAIGVTALCWSLITNRLGIGQRSKVLGLVGLLGGYAVLKFTSFYPVLTDVPALAIGALSMYLWLRGWSWWLALLTVLGAFTWLAQLSLGLLLLLFPYRGQLGEPATGISTLRDDARASLWMGRAVVAAAALVGSAGAAAGIALTLGIEEVESEENPWLYLAAENPGLSLAGAVVLGAYLFGALSSLPGRPHLTTVGRGIRSLVGVRLLLVALLYGGVRVAQSRLTTIAPDDKSTLERFEEILVTTVSLPGRFLVAHAVYFGPIVLVAALRWRAVARTARTVGVGAVVALAALVLFALDSESRHLINFLPLVVMLTVLALDRLPPSWGEVGGFGMLSLLASKAWLTIGPFSPDRYGEFPAQRYYMSQGPYMSVTTYVVQAAATLGVALLLALWLHRRAVPRGSTPALRAPAPG